MYKHIVVTGGAGFVGSNLVLELAKRYPEAELTVVDDFRSGNFKNLEGFKGDVIAADLADFDTEALFRRERKSTSSSISPRSPTRPTTTSSARCTTTSSRGATCSTTSRAARRGSSTPPSAATYGIAAGVNKIEQAPKPANVYAFAKVQLDNLARRLGRGESRRRSSSA